MIADRAIQQITVADLERLVSNGVAESRTLEYKEALPGGADQDKREFLADVSSFANAIGGDLVYGVREKRDETGKPTGTPEAIVGIDVGNLDQATQRLENVLRDGIAPRIPSIRFWPVGAFERGPALIVRIPRSWAAPHMVTFQQSGKFFTLVQDALAGYLEELALLRDTLDTRYDDLKSGRVQPIDGDEAFARLREESEHRRSRPDSRMMPLRFSASC